MADSSLRKKQRMADRSFIKRGVAVPLFCWPESAFTKHVLTPVVYQGFTCSCYSHVCTEAIRAAKNTKNNFAEPVVPQLSATELFINCHGIPKCKGNQMGSAMEHAVRNSVVVDERLPFDPENAVFTSKEAKNDQQKIVPGPRHNIDEWHPLPNNESVLLEAVIKTPIPIDALWSVYLDAYTGGAVNLGKLSKLGTEFYHALLLVGFGIFICDDGDTINIWIAKNSFGCECGVDGYIYLIRNSSLPSTEWTAYNPILPLVFSSDEERQSYDPRIVARSMDLPSLAEQITDDRCDFIILFFDDNYAELKALLHDFDRISRCYMHDSFDTICAKVNITGQREALVDYGLRKWVESSNPILKVYKFVDKTGKQKKRYPKRDGRCLELHLDMEWDYFYMMAAFLFKAVGGTGERLL